MRFRAVVVASLLISATHGFAGTLAESAREPQPPAHLQKLLRQDGVTSGADRLPFRPATGSEPGDYLWSDDFGLPSPDGILFCAVRFGSDLIVGGIFGRIGNVSANNVARWDGTAWHPVGEGLDHGVTSLAVYDGDLYAAGRFQYVGEHRSPLARWDGDNWSPVGTIPASYNCCYEVNSMVVYRDELIVGGAYRPPGSASFRAVASWNGSDWKFLSMGVNGFVNAMLVAGDSLFVAGGFDSAGVVPAENVAVWNGSDWSGLGAGLRRLQYSRGVQSLAWFQGRLFAGGDFDSTGGGPTGLAAWDGSEWSDVEGYDEPWAPTLTVHNDTLAVASYGRVHRWDGVSWSYLYGLTGVPTTLLADESGLIAVGYVSINTEVPSGFSIARWDGRSWVGYENWDGRMKGLANFQGGPGAVLCLTSFQGDLVTGGYMEYAGAGSQWEATPRVSRWNGSTWSAMYPDRYAITSAFLAEGDTLFAVGSFFNMSYWNNSAAARWEAGQWTLLDTLSGYGTCLVRHGGNLVMGTGGSYESPGGVYVWDGTKWNSIGSVDGPPGYGVGVSSLAVYGSTLVAAGNFESIGGVTANGIASWDGQTWRPLDGTPDPYPTFLGPSIAVYGARLVATRPSLHNGRPVPLIAWDGTAWSAVEGITGVASVMGIAGGRLFVSGDLKIGSEQERVTLAMWNGRTWRSLGSGVNGTIYSLAEHEGALYVGGYFSTAGIKSSYGIARWDGFTASAPPTARLSPGRPNPFRATVDFVYELERNEVVRVAVHDVRGREVAVLGEGTIPAGPHTIRWDGRDRMGKPVASGVYFLSVRNRAGGVVSRKVVRFR